ncbi:unnamed protein product [Closterium sp. NIES-53]
MRKGTGREEDLADLALQGGMFGRCLGRIAAFIKHPPQMYLLGFLFGLGFDTTMAHPSPPLSTTPGRSPRLQVFRATRNGTAREADLEDLTLQGGMFGRCLGRIAALIKHPPQMYLLGFLFGLGFDTATEVALLFMAAGAASSGLPWFAILCLPVIFAAGMTLLDTIDGSFMNFAYSWAFSFPLRKLFFNIVITGLSVMVALLIGGIELLQLVIEKAGWEGQPWDSIAGMDLNILGFVIVGLFFLTWMVALAVWHLMQYEKSPDL